MPEPCPSLDRLRAVLDGRLPPHEQTALTQHLDGCSTCQQRLERLASGSKSWEDVARQLRQAVKVEEPPSILQKAWRVVRQEPAAITTQPSAESTNPSASDFPFLQPSGVGSDLGRLGPYPILKLLGQGGMGLVFKGIDPTLGRLVAIKVMAPQLAASETSRQRFLREARSAAAVRHKNVVAIHAVAETEGLPYLVMQFVAGRSLQDRLNREGQLPPLEAARIGLQMAQGLAAAHAQRLVHRDVKPANVLIEDRTDQVKITNFGLARAVDDVRLTRTGVIAGTPAFMSPEQARGDSVDHRTDLFSLGSVLYTLCTGQAPFRTPQILELLRLVCEQTPQPIQQLNPSVPNWLAKVIDRLHAKDPGQRFASAQEVADVLEHQLAHLEATMTKVAANRPKRPPGASRLREQFRGGVSAPVLVVGTLLLVLAGGTAVFFARPGSAPPNLPSEEVASSEEKGNEVVKTSEHFRQDDADANVSRELAGANEKDQEDVRDSGQTVLMGCQFWKIDGNQQANPNSPDFRWEQIGDTVRNLVPSPGAGWALLQDRDFEKVGALDLSKANYSAGKLSGTVLRPDTVLALRTSAGKLAKAKVIRYRELHDFSFPEAARVSADWKKFVLGKPNVKEYHLEMSWVLYGKKAVKVGELRRLEGHHGWGIRGLAFTPDGKRALSSDSDGNVILWDLVNGREIRRLVGHRGEACLVAVAADGKRAVSGGGDGTVRVWDLDTGKEVRNFPGRSRVIGVVALSANGKQALSSSAEGIIRLWDVATGQELRRLEGHKDDIRAVTFSRDDRLALSGSRDKTVRLWDVTTGKELKRFVGHTHWVAGVALSAYGRLAASASWDQTVRVWEVATCKEVSRLQGHGAAVEGVAFTPDGRYVLSGGLDRILRLHDARTTRELHRLEGHGGAVYALAISPNGRWALSGGADLSLRLWQLAEPAPEGNNR